MLSLVLKIIGVLLLIGMLYITIVLYRAYKTDPSQNVHMMDNAKAGILSCAKQIKKLVSTQNCDRGR